MRSNGMIVFLAGLVPLALVALAVGCRDDDGEEPSNGEDDVAAVEEAVDEVLVVFQGRRLGGLRALAGAILLDRAGVDEFDRLASCVPRGASVDLVDQEIAVSGDTASSTLTFEVSENGGSSELERVWEFERQDDGRWRLSDLPECPFE